jgi:transcriptional regulator with GAF, ATPase, and Fis domain
VTESSTSALAEAMAEVAKAINAPHDLGERLDAIVQAAPNTVPGFDHVSVSLAYRDAPVHTRAASSDLVEKLDFNQYETEQGPCFEAFTRLNVVKVPSVRHEQRWPDYIPRAHEAGVMAQLAVPLGGDGDKVRGSLNLYSTSREGIDPDAVGVATMFATHVTLALGWARTEEQLNEALATRKSIGQAIGIVMERYQINDDQAFGFLTRVSSTSNIKLRDVARELIAQTDTRYTVKES